MKVREAMAKSISTAEPGDTIRHVAELMKRDGTGFIPVCNDGHVVGVITDRDIVVRCVAGGGDVAADKAEKVMHRNVECIEADAEIEGAIELMAARAVRRLPVVDGEHKLVGVITHGNLVQAVHGKARKATEAITIGA